jgi:flagellin FlaB
MFENKLNTDEQERGQVGIGTLIVFIALVLVAAIAAGVLINTAGFLQSQAEATGEESTSQVSNNLNVYSATGADVAGNGDINEIRVTVGKAPGADAIDLTNVEIQWVNGASYVLDTSTTGQIFGIEDVQGAGDDVLTNSSDRAEIVIDTENTNYDTSSISAMTAGDTATLTLTTADGAQTTVVLNAPEPLETPTDL